MSHLTQVKLDEQERQFDGQAVHEIMLFDYTLTVPTGQLNRHRFTVESLNITRYGFINIH